MKNWSLCLLCLLFDEPKRSLKILMAFSYSVRGLISSFICLNVILEMEYCSGEDLMIK